jgi:hypothetical protein
MTFGSATDFGTFATIVLAVNVQLMVQSIITIAGGILGAAGFIVSKSPNAKDLIEKLVPLQGIIGIIMVLVGILNILQFIQALSVITGAPLHMVVFIAVMLVNLGLGFLLAFGLISKWFLSKDEAAKAKGEALRAKLVMFQTPLGLAGIAFGLWFLIAFSL